MKTTGSNWVLLAWKQAFKLKTKNFSVITGILTENGHIKLSNGYFRLENEHFWHKMGHFLLKNWITLSRDTFHSYNYIFSLKTLIVIYVVYFSSRSRHDLGLVSRSVWARCEIVSGKAVWTCKLNVFKISNEVYGVCNSHKDTNQVGLSKKIWTSYVTHIYKCNGFQLNFWV